jgi:hypothetical protein
VASRLGTGRYPRASKRVRPDNPGSETIKRVRLFKTIFFVA